MGISRLLLALTALLTLGACQTNPSTGRSQFIVIPADQVAAMGEEAKPQVIAEFGGEVESAELRAYVARVGNDLAMHVEPEFDFIDWEFFALRSEVINAFALPGGKIFITVGLLTQFDNEAQLAGVLGHEIGHVTARHVDERLSQTLVAQIGLAAIGAYSESALISQGAGVAAQGVLLKWGRDQESESDTQGLKYMTAAGYDPEGMYQVMEVLLEASQSGDRPPEILSTHPYPETRLERIRAALERDYAYTRGSARYRLYKDRYRAEARPHLGAP
jgi:predicted Zn-dependent protease